MDKRTLWYSNLILLGFDTDEVQKKTNIVFSPDMFRVANVKGMEQVVFFFFENIFSPHRTKEVFRIYFFVIFRLKISSLFYFVSYLAFPWYLAYS